VSIENKWIGSHEYAQKVALVVSVEL
jgi:hypothetical protein